MRRWAHEPILVPLLPLMAVCSIGAKEQPTCNNSGVHAAGMVETVHDIEKVRFEDTAGAAMATRSEKTFGIFP